MSQAACRYGMPIVTLRQGLGAQTCNHLSQVVMGQVVMNQGVIDRWLSGL